MESTSPTRARDDDARWTPTRDDANDANDDGDALARTRHDDDGGGYDVEVANVVAKKFRRASFEWSWIR